MVMGDAGDAAEDGDDVDCIVHIRAPVCSLVHSYSALFSTLEVRNLEFRARERRQIK